MIACLRVEKVLNKDMNQVFSASLGRALGIVAVVCLGSLPLTGCEGVRDAVGLNKRVPDEFTVLKKPPLVLPPDFNLRPPGPGGPPGSEGRSQDSARAALSGAGTTPRVRAAGSGAAPSKVSGRSDGEAALLQRAGASAGNPSIRQIILRETTQLSEKDQSFADRLIFWRKPQPPGDVVDAEKESQRLRQARASGVPRNVGETPTIKRRKRALLEGIF